MYAAILDIYNKMTSSEDNNKTAETLSSATFAWTTIDVVMPLRPFNASAALVYQGQIYIVARYICDWAGLDFEDISGMAGQLYIGVPVGFGLPKVDYNFRVMSVDATKQVLSGRPRHLAAFTNHWIHRDELLWKGEYMALIKMRPMTSDDTADIPDEVTALSAAQPTSMLRPTYMLLQTSSLLATMRVLPVEALLKVWRPVDNKTRRAIDSIIRYGFAANGDNRRAAEPKFVGFGSAPTYWTNSGATNHTAVIFAGFAIGGLDGAKPEFTNPPSIAQIIHKYVANVSAAVDNHQYDTDGRAIYSICTKYSDGEPVLSYEDGANMKVGSTGFDAVAATHM